MLKLCRRHDRVLMSGWHNTLQTRLVISGNVNLRQRPSSKNKNVHGRPRHLCLCPRFKPRASASNASQRGLRDCSRRSWTMHPSTGEGAQGKGRARARQHGESWLSAPQRAEDRSSEAAADSRSTWRQEDLGAGSGAGSGCFRPGLKA